MRLSNLLLLALSLFLFVSCGSEAGQEAAGEEPSTADSLIVDIDKRLGKYVPVRLTTDMGKLSGKQKQMIPVLIEAGKIMDELFWYEAYGEKEELLNSLNNEGLKRYATINYGPWDRLEGNEPFINGVGAKPAGANYYPTDMDKEEFNNAALEDKSSLYTFLRRDESGMLMTIPYREQFAEQVQKASGLLRQAAALADNEALKHYLNLRADALLSDDYQASDMAWLDMKDNQIDVVIGPIETYEDQLFGAKAAHECYVLVKDMDWSQRLEKYAAFLPELQKGIPVPAPYKTEEPGSDAQLNAYDVVFYAGDCNAGSKTIAINLPNDEEVQLKKGTRRLQLKNAMRAKFDKILLPISEVLIDESQRQHITFDAFFSNTMFHEVAHGLGIKNTINGKGTVRETLQETCLRSGRRKGRHPGFVYD